jgi:hypothetical protein
MTDIPYLLRLRDDLVTGIGQRQRRVSARRRRAALVLTPAAVAGAALATSLTGGSSPALAIESEGDWIQVRIADIAASEAEMESELRAAGIDADLRLVPTTPEHVGQWSCVSYSTSAGWSSTMSALGDDASVLPRPPQTPDSRQIVRLGQNVRVMPEVLYIQQRSAERLELTAGRAPEAGEQPEAHPEICGDMRRSKQP